MMTAVQNGNRQGGRINMRITRIAAKRVDANLVPFGEVLVFDIMCSYDEWLRTNNRKYRVIMAEMGRKQ
jgi:hypothetical protein